jgi:hypothetical protein
LEGHVYFNSLASNHSRVLRCARPAFLKDNVSTKKANAAAIKQEKDLALLMTDTTALDAE